MTVSPRLQTTARGWAMSRPKEYETQWPASQGQKTNWEAKKKKVAETELVLAMQYAGNTETGSCNRKVSLLRDKDSRAAEAVASQSADVRCRECCAEPSAPLAGGQPANRFDVHRPSTATREGTRSAVAVRRRRTTSQAVAAFAWLAEASSLVVCAPLLWSRTVELSRRRLLVER
ncbi:hypothetical protein MRX96_011272 [Rhipicephalus microplus]